MIIKDMFLLERSEKFYISHREEITVNLNLKKALNEPKTRIYGKVIDRCGNLINGATVKIFTLKYEPVKHIVTDRCGSFLFDNIIMPGMYNVIATAEGYNISKGYTIVVSSNIPTKLSIVLEEERRCNLGVIYGKVKDAMGNGICNAEVKIYDYYSHEEIVLFHTNGDGEYMICGLEFGKYYIEAVKNGYIFPGEVSFIIYNDKFEKLDLFLYQLVPYKKGTISGQILYQGCKVAYAVVELYQLYEGHSNLIKIKECNEDGVYLFDNIDAGTYIVKCNSVSHLVKCKLKDE